MYRRYQVRLLLIFAIMCRNAISKPLLKRTAHIFANIIIDTLSKCPQILLHFNFGSTFALVYDRKEDKRIVYHRSNR